MKITKLSLIGFQASSTFYHVNQVYGDQLIAVKQPSGNEFGATITKNSTFKVDKSVESFNAFCIRADWQIAKTFQTENHGFVGIYLQSSSVCFRFQI